MADLPDGTLVEHAHAKINLHLHVVGRRDDGYHLLDSLVVFAGVHDRLSAGTAHGLSLSVGGPFGEALQSDDMSGNLVARAARLLHEGFGAAPAGAALLLEKNLPVASGIGGGSADAAACLRLLCRLWAEEWPDRRPDPGRLRSIALSLGADVPVCLAQVPACMGGIGEVLAPAPEMPGCFMVLVNCGLAVSTPSVFAARPPGFRPPARLPESWPDAAAMAADLRLLFNDLEQAAIALCPTIADVLTAIDAQPGCLLSRMSGSGATCFGLFATRSAADAAAIRLRRPDWWVWGGGLAGPA